MWAVGQGFEAGEAEDKTNQAIFLERAEHESAVVDGGDEQVRGDDLGLTAGPDGALQVFDRGHLFGGFEDLDSRHMFSTTDEKDKRDFILSLSSLLSVVHSGGLKEGKRSRSFSAYFFACAVRQRERRWVHGMRRRYSSR